MVNVARCYELCKENIMKSYQVTFKYETYAHYTVEATDQAEAENIALGLLQNDGGDYLHHGEWTNAEIEEL